MFFRSTFGIPFLENILGQAATWIFCFNEESRSTSAEHCVIRESLTPPANNHYYILYLDLILDYLLAAPISSPVLGDCKHYQKRDESIGCCQLFDNIRCHVLVQFEPVDVSYSLNRSRDKMAPFGTLQGT